MTMNDQLADELSLIERALVSGEWTPTPDELKLGNDFLVRSTSLAQAEGPEGLPRPLHEWDRGLVRHLSTHARLVREAPALVSALPVRHQEPPSRMHRLVEIYVAAGQDLLPYADRVLDAWNRTPPTVDEEQLTQYMRLSGRSAEDARDHLWRDAVREWEGEQLSPEDHAVLDAATRPMSLAATIMVAAVTGETWY
jgi:hypothetical protein